MRAAHAVRASGLAASLRAPFAATAALMAVITVAFLVITDLPLAIYSPVLDVAIHTLGTVVALAAAGLCFARYREQGGTPTLLQASALLVIGTANLVNEAVVLTGLDRQLG